MRKKIAKHVKGVREKKTSTDKERSFHRVSPSITRTLVFIFCTTLFHITRSTRNAKYKRGKRTTNLNYPNNYIHGEETTLKTFSKLLFLQFCSYWAIYRPKGALGIVYGATRQITTRGSKLWPRKRGNGRAARHRLPRAVSSSPYLLYLLLSVYGHPVLIDSPSKVNGYMCRL